MLWPIEITGRRGRRIRDLWGDSDARAYLGITVPGFPNMFVLYGPNTGMLHGGSYAFIAECQFTYIIDCLRQMIDSGCRAIDVRRDVFQRYNDTIDDKLKGLVWSDPKIRSWHKNSAGRVIANGPWRVLDYWQLTRHADLGEYEMER
jgi:4-hydroxyacetophenone monooxygenase